MKTFLITWFEEHNQVVNEYDLESYINMITDRDPTLKFTVVQLSEVEIPN